MNCKLLRSKIVAVAIILMGILTIIVSYTYAETNDNALYIDPSGNVKIGTDKQTAVFEVKGSLKAENIDAAESVKARNIEATESLQAKEITLPSGTTVERPKSPKDGSIRYNTTSKTVEVFIDGNWYSIATTPKKGDNVQCFYYTGQDQTFVVPTGVTKILVKVWGAGGAGGTKGDWKRSPKYFTYGFSGGGGGFSRGYLTVKPNDKLKVVVGQGGQVHQVGSGYGGGGAATSDNVNNLFCGGGGGRSAVFLDDKEQIVFGGGGGGGGSGCFDHTLGTEFFTILSNNGGAGGGEKGENGEWVDNIGKYVSPNPWFGGTGGDQASAGVGGKENGGSGDGANGGVVKPNFSGGGGGGGWRGGGSGARTTTAICGGGGGSGHIGSGVAGETKSGKGQQCPMQDDPDYLPGIGIGGEGGEYGENGGNGLVVIRW